MPVRHLRGQGLIAFWLQKIQVLVIEPCQEALERRSLDVGLGHMFAQVGFDAVQVILGAASLTRQRQQARLGVQ